MAAWRNLAILVVALAVVQSASAQSATYTLSEPVQPGDCFNIRLSMKLAGEMMVQRDEKAVPIPLAATATHDYAERVLTVVAGLCDRNARYYQTAKADIKVGDNPMTRELRGDRRVVIAQRVKERPVSYCPSGPFTPDEQELTSEHFDTLSVSGLLPGKEGIAVGQTWKIANPVVQSLCGFDGLVSQNLEAKLQGVENNIAKIALAGTATGIDLGAMAKLEITASCTYDVAKKRITSVEWKQKDARDQGPASPASSVQTSWTMTRTYLEEEPKELSDYALVSAKYDDQKGEPPAPVLQLWHKEAKDRFQMTYARDWQMVGQTPEHVILRMVDRGEFVAQATITPWTKSEPGKHLSADEFKDAMADTPGWEADEIRDQTELNSEKGHWVYRLSALGEMDGVKVLQNFYLIAGPQGDQVVVAVTLKPSLAEKLGTRDLKLVDGIDFAPKAK